MVTAKPGGKAAPDVRIFGEGRTSEFLTAAPERARNTIRDADNGADGLTS
jgi:hypothetical protein